MFALPYLAKAALGGGSSPTSAAASAVTYPHRTLTGINLGPGKEVPRRAGPVWKFGYGSNMSQDYLRVKKGLKPLGSRRTVLKGFTLAFPEGFGIDFVDPTFATLKRDPNGTVHGVSTLLGPDCVASIDAQESTYDVEVCLASAYADGDGDGVADFEVEAYVSRKDLTNRKDGPTSKRYRNVLVRGAEEMHLDGAWLAKLKALPVYTPPADVMAARARLPSPSDLPVMTIAELAEFKGEGGKAIYTCACGYVFDDKPIFKSYYGRDVTQRNVLHMRGINLDANDDGGKSPFPRLSQLAPDELEFALQNRDRFIMKSGGPIAVLKEFWEEQDREFAPVYSGNTLSRL